MLIKFLKHNLLNKYLYGEFMKKYKNILIYGYGKSGQAVKKVLEKNQIKFSIYDNLVLEEENYIPKLSKKIITQFDLVVISPGVSIYDKYVKLAIKNKIEVISELEFGYRIKNKKSKIIAITGTNGKTTTSSMINDCLIASGINCVVAGNIGTPLTSVSENDYDYIVCEVSSYQLEAVKQFKANIACIINIAEDHLDRHKNMKNYISCKLKIFNNQTRNDFAIINIDDEYFKLIMNVAKNRKIYTSKSTINKGCFIKNNIITFKTNKETKVIHVNDIKLPKVFLDDILIVCAVVKILGVENKYIYEVVEKYFNLSNKHEILTNTGNILVVNDSKATNIHAVLESASIINCEIILLLGGKDKKLNFDIFFNKVTANVKSIIVFGQVKSRVLKAAKKNKFNNIYAVKNLYAACDMAVAIVKSGQAILFSPACSSYNEFANYAERGEFFKKTIYQLLGNE